MMKEIKGKRHTDEEETIRAFVKFRSLPEREQAFAIAFINGMSFQRSISKSEKASAN